MLAFGPDGYLYIGMGDGGGSGDPSNSAQDVDALLGKILRIDINGTAGARQYRIPATTRTSAATGRNEIWACGLRNPWSSRSTARRATSGSATSARTGTRRSTASTSASSATAAASTSAGGSLEGRHCYSPASGCNTTGKRLPVVEYSH